jgi:hypothetical protein
MRHTMFIDQEHPLEGISHVVAENWIADKLLHTVNDVPHVQMNRLRSKTALLVCLCSLKLDLLLEPLQSITLVDFLEYLVLGFELVA